MNEKIAMEIDKWLYDIEQGKETPRRRGTYSTLLNKWQKYAKVILSKPVVDHTGRRRPPVICSDRAFIRLEVTK